MEDRLARVLPSANGKAEYNMKVMMRALQPSIVPEPNKYYTFVYQAKTRHIQYDKHPLIQCTTVHPWGFIGVNFHLEDYRRYTWREVISNIFEIREDEMGTALKFQTAKIIGT